MMITSNTIEMKKRGGRNGDKCFRAKIESLYISRYKS